MSKSLLHENLLLVAEQNLLASMRAFKPSERQLRDKAEAEEERRYGWNHTEYEPDDTDDDNY